MMRRLATGVMTLSVVATLAAPAGAALHGRHLGQKHPAAHRVLKSHRALLPHATLAPPTNVAGSAGDQSATFTWSPAGGASRYTVVLKPDNAMCVAVLTTCVVRGLTNATTYTANVYSVNGSGSSAPSAPVTVTPQAAVPAAPSGVSASPFGLHARVSWNPVVARSNPITGYTATASPGGATCTTTTTSCVIFGLTAGTAYTFTVVATNVIGDSVASLPSASVTVTDRPSAPQNLVLAPAPESIGVSWDAPASDGGLVIDGYLATVFLASSGAPVAHCRTSGATSCEITGLNVATSYVVRAIAHNAEGYSAASDTAGPVTTGYYVPGSPLSVSATAGAESVVVAWSVPASDGGGAITGYTATADDGLGGVFTCTTVTLTCTISGLTDGTTYAVSVVATNGVGDSKASTSQAATPGNVPDAPTGVAATLGNGQVSVSWTAPVKTGGTAIQSYTVTADDGQGGVFTCVSLTTSCVVVGLTNGTTYTITVVATNLTGDSLSSTSTTQTPQTVPGAPTIGTVTPGDGSLAVDFTAPTSDGGASVTGYTVTADDGQGGVFTCTTTTTSCTVTGLSNGTAYTVSVSATNANGDSLASAAEIDTPYTTPGAAESVNATKGDGSLVIAWTAPASDGGDAIYRYTATADDGNGGVFTCTTNTLTCNITGLTNGTTYSITVVATNNAGDSIDSTATTGTPQPSAFVPDAPGNVTATVFDGSLSIAWDWPINDGGSGVSSFLVTGTDESGNSFTCIAGPGISPWWTACSLTGLTNDVVYSITVVAINAVGSSSPSTAITAAPAGPPPVVPPDVPANVLVTAGDRSIGAIWDAPAATSSEVISYLVTATDPSGNTFTCVAGPNISMWWTACVITGLTNGVLYSVTVHSTNSGGNSDESAAQNATPVGLADAPTDVAAVSKNTVITVSWVAPLYTGGQEITGYTVTAIDSNENTFTCTSTSTTCDLTGLTNGIVYDITVLATNASGDSADSTVVSSTAYTTPNKPQNVSTYPGVSSVYVTWDAPDSDGGSAITHYIVTAYDANGDPVSSCTAAGNEYGCTVLGLTNFENYNFKVVAYNAAGSSAANGMPNLPNPQAIIEWGGGWLAYDNWIGFVGSDPSVTATYSSANYDVTEGWDCNVRFMVAGPEGTVYTENNCGDMYIIYPDGSSTYIGYNPWGSNYQFTVGPNGELIFASDYNALHLYDYSTSSWYTKYIDGSDCIDGITTDINGTIWISDICRGDIAAITDNIFDQVDGNWYNANWQYLELCSPWWLSTDSSGLIYIGNDYCQQGYTIFDPNNGPTWVPTPNSYPEFVGGVAGVAYPINFDPWPHRFVDDGVPAMPQSNEPSSPTNAYIYTWGSTFVSATWSNPQYQGFGGSVTSYRLTATGPEGDVHSCTTNQLGLTYFDSGSYTCMVTGLIDGVSYQLSVVATNAAGDSILPASMGSFTTYGPSISVPTDFTSLTNFTNVMLSSVSASGANITVDNLPQNWMVTVYAINATLSMSQWRYTSPAYQVPYWGSGSVMSFPGDTSSVNFDLSHLMINANQAGAKVSIFAVATPNNVLYNPATGHYYIPTWSSSHWGSFADQLTFASQQSFMGLQGYMAAPFTSAAYNFIEPFSPTGTFYAGSDDPAFIKDPTTGLPMFSYLWANNDSSTSWTPDFQSDPNASFQKWYIVAGPDAGTQFSNGGMLIGSGGGTYDTGVGVNGYPGLWCGGEPNAAGLNETVLMASGTCWNDISAGWGGYTVLEFGGMAGDTPVGSAEVDASGFFNSYAPVPSAPRDVNVTGDQVQGFNINWTSPLNADTVDFNGFNVYVYIQNGDGSETLVWSSFVYSWQGSVRLGTMAFPSSYRISVVAFNDWGSTASSDIFYAPIDLSPHAVSNVVVGGDGLYGYNVTWSAPDNYYESGVGSYTISVYKQNGDGTETLTWSSQASAWSTYSEIYGVAFPNSYRVAIVANGATNVSPETSATYTPINVHPQATISDLTVTGNSVSMTYTVTSTYGSWWNHMDITDANGTWLAGCGYVYDGTYNCSLRNLPANTTLNYTLTIFAPQWGWETVSTGTFTTGDVLRPADAVDVSFTPLYWSADLSWTLPENNTTNYWRADIYTVDAQGNETFYTSSYNWWGGATSMSVGSLSPLQTYKIVLYAIDFDNILSKGVSSTITMGDPYVQISKASLTVWGNAVTGAWTTAEGYGPMWYTTMNIYKMDGTFVESCSDYSGVGANTCWNGGLALSTDYYVLIQGYGWFAGTGGGVRINFTTGLEYVAGNYHDVLGAAGYIYTSTMTSDGATWYYATDGLVHRILNGVDTTVNPRDILPSTVSLSRVVALPNNGVAFSTTNYDNGWANSGVYYITVDGAASYVASDSTNCASYLVAYGTDSVVVSNWYGLTVINYVTGDVSYLPGLPQWSQNYAMLVPSNDGYIYFVDRYDGTLLHRYDGATGDSANYTDMRFTGMNWQGAAVINGVLYNFDNPSWNVYILQGVNMSSGVATSMVNFANVMETPRIMGYTSDGSLAAATSYNLLTITALPNLG